LTTTALRRPCEPAALLHQDRNFRRPESSRVKFGTGVVVDRCIDWRIFE
jgi:hypothetical protein